MKLWLKQQPNMKLKNSLKINRVKINWNSNKNLLLISKNKPIYNNLNNKRSNRLKNSKRLFSQIKYLKKLVVLEQ